MILSLQNELADLKKSVRHDNIVTRWFIVVSMIVGIFIKIFVPSPEHRNPESYWAPAHSHERSHK